MAIGSPRPSAWNRDRMTKTHRKGKKKAKKGVSKKRRQSDTYDRGADPGNLPYE